MTSDLHERLLVHLAIERFDSPTEVRLAGVLATVVELHAPVTTYPGGTTSVGPIPLCAGHDLIGYDADYPRWPCSTVQAIARELGIEAAP